jgi:hypothetical protein
MTIKLSIGATVAAYLLHNYPACNHPNKAIAVPATGLSEGRCGKHTLRALKAHCATLLGNLHAYYA